MHSYATSSSRHRLIAYLAIGSAVAAAGVGSALQDVSLPGGITVGAPSAVIFFTLVFFLFDRYVWRVSVWGHNLTATPDLNGIWTGEIDIRKGKGWAERRLASHSCQVRITQTWTQISIRFETESTLSNSLMASLGPPGPEGGGLRYEYDVELKPGAKSLAGGEGVRHRGMAQLSPKRGNDWKILEGKYYNDQEHQRWGLYKLERL